MLSFLKYLWESTDGSKRQRDLQEKLEKELQFLEEEAAKEGEKVLDSTKISFGSINAQLKKSTTNENGNENENDATDCFKAMGLITTLKSNHGTIDNNIFFDMECALAVSNELKIGSRVGYLAFRNRESEHIKVVKILEVVDNYWDEKPTEVKIEETINELRKEKPTFFKIHKRNILGIVTERKTDSIVIDTENCKRTINLEQVEVEFVPKIGDRVYVVCNVQSDDNYVDQQGEIIQEVSVHPSRVQNNEKCMVKRLNDDFGVLDENIYFTFDILPPTLKLGVGDVVIVDMIECEMMNFTWRVIKLKLHERALMQNVVKPKLKKRKDNVAVTISEDVVVKFSGTFKTQEVKFHIKNNIERSLKCLSIEMQGKRRLVQSRLIEPDPGKSFELQSGEELDIIFEVESKFFGETREMFILQFENFQVRRSIMISVSEDHAVDEVTKRSDMAVSETMILPMGGRNVGQRSRQYANQVWAKKAEVIPGVGMACKRRFLARHIGYFEVPERLRKAYLTSSSRAEMLENIETMFNCLQVDVNFSNYTTRFQTLLFLEEIEYFVNFRQYDRERAHFTRDSDYLSLTIENLAEKRPSLVIGDTVRAISPWSIKNGDNRCYDGIIHKVLFNRVLLKFNQGFQEKYNGEDYRLEFYFSRFGFRKQHYAINEMPKILGEQFLFPSRIRLREAPQLDISLDENENLLFHETECKWFNDSLNLVQKQAITHILRGEADNMPYIIFGPPGTGKTMTLVETMLQLVKHMPNARLLVGTPSNSAADLITSRLIKSGVLEVGDFVRLVSQNQIEKELIPEELLKYCATVDIAADGTCEDTMVTTESGLKLRCQMRFLGRHRITISTCTTLGNFLQMGFPADHFTHVLIDESGQCTEPEVMIPICQIHKRRGQVILAGDPNQLSPIVVNRYAGDHGLSTSFLERLLRRTPYAKDVLRFPDSHGFDRRLVTKLIFNYRSLPSILSVYSELFYDAELLPMIQEKTSREAKCLKELVEVLPFLKARPKSHGAFFYGVRCENKQESDSPSWYNPGEAKNIFFTIIQFYRENVHPDSIGIITPYMKQVKHLRQLFIEAGIQMPKIGSVEEFQGQERDIIFISTVRSSKKYVANDLKHSLGFVQSAKRMNVAISRARYFLIVFGNPHLLWLDQCWRSYIKYCIDNEAYAGCDLPANMDDGPDDTNNENGET